MQKGNSKIITWILVIIIALGAWCFLVNDKSKNQISNKDQLLDQQQNPSSMSHFNQNGYSFDYESTAEIKSNTNPTPDVFYSELTTGNQYNSVRFYPDVLPSNFRPEFFTGTTVINGKTFYYGDVQTEAGIERSYMYKKNGMTIVIQNDSLIDLGSVEIQLNNLEESNQEVFHSQPGAIKSVTVLGNNQWMLEVDLLTGNPNWIPGVGSEPFFLNQNPKIRNLKVTGETKIYGCPTQYADGSTMPANLQNPENYINDIYREINGGNYAYNDEGIVGPVKYFNINGSNITVIQTQCLP